MKAKAWVTAHITPEVAAAFEQGADAARWAIKRHRVMTSDELAGRVRVGHLSPEFAAGYDSEVEQAAEVIHVPEVVA